MQTDPNIQISPPITVEQFNQNMRDWTLKVRNKSKSRLRNATTGEATGKGLRSITPSLKSEFGEIYSTGFKFNYYLVFVHYGVGRGYVHRNGAVMRGHRTDNDKHRRYRGRPAKTWKNYAGDNRPVRRHGFDWLDIEIRNGINDLADLAAEYHGDKAALSVLNQGNKLLIDKTYG